MTDCEHKWYPVKLEDPKGDRNHHVLYVACPKCGAYKILYAHWEE